MTNATTASNDNATDRFETRIGVGVTLEVGSVRIHCYETCTTVTDLTHAGKRGKKCVELVVYSQEGYNACIDKFAAIMVAGWAEMGESIERIAAELADSYTVARREHRGVDVTPAGSEIHIVNEWMTATFKMTGFSAKDYTDVNETMIMSLDNQKRSAVKAHAWVKANRATVEGMRFRELTRAMREAGIDFHMFCGLD